MKNFYRDILAMNHHTRSMNNGTPGLWLMHSDEFFADLNDDHWGNWDWTVIDPRNGSPYIEWNW